MNNIEDMPPKCHNCPYWEMCKEPYVCPTQEKLNAVQFKENTRHGEVIIRGQDND